MNLYKNKTIQTKTICQKLIPVGATRDTIEKYQLMAVDKKIADNKAVINKMFGLIASKHINDTLGKLKGLDFELLLDQIENLNKAKNNNEEDLRVYFDDIFETKKELADQISKELSKVKFTGKTIFEKSVYNFLETYKGEDANLMKELTDLILEYNYTEIFKKNLEKIEDSLGFQLKAGRVVTRILSDNSNIFEYNLEKFNDFDYLKELDIKDVIPLTKKDYENFITAEGIAKYNQFIGEINLKLNLYCQQNKEVSYNKLELKQLQKMLYGEKVSFIDKLEEFKTDKQVIDAYNEFAKAVNESGILEDIKKSLPDSDSIIINKNRISYYSNKITGNWSAIKKKFDSEKEYKKAIEDGLTISQINDLLSDVKHGDYIENLLSALEKKFAIVKEDAKVSLKNDNSINSQIIKKEYEYILDLLQDLKAFDCDSEYMDSTFASSIRRAQDLLRSAIVLYNRTRNYITKKPDPHKKHLVKFGSGTIGTGISTSVEAGKRASFLKDGDNIYLIVYNKMGCDDNNISVAEAVRCVNMTTTGKRDNCYQKMIYATTGDIKKQIPRVFVYKSDDKELIKDFKAGKHKTDLDYLNNRLIPFLKESFKNHESYKEYTINFKDEYTSYDEFCEDVGNQAYIMKWEWIDKSVVDKFVEAGVILMFRVYNRYMKKKSGRISKHARLIKELFSDENINNTSIKMLSTFDIFYRDVQIENPYIHKAGTTLYNKRDKDGNSIVDYKKMVENNEKRENVYTTTKPYDIIKDRRYTKEHFQINLHLQVGKKEEKETDNDIQKEILESKKNRLVITKSNKHLLYAVVFDENSNIIFKKSLNTVNGVNYKSKLESVEIQKKENTINWKTVGSNQMLLEGYCSFAIKEIKDLMKEYDALLVLENNSFGKNLLNERSYTSFKEKLITSLALEIDYENKDFYSYTNKTGGKVATWRDTPVNGVCIQVPTAYKVKDPCSNYSPVSFFAKTKADKIRALKKVKSFKYNDSIGLFEVDINKNATSLNTPMSCKSFGSRGITDNDNQLTVDCTSYVSKMLSDAGIDYEKVNNILKDLCKLDKIDIEAIHQSVNTICKAFNGNTYLSPCSNEKGEHFMLEDDDIFEVISAINYLIRSDYVTEQYINEKKIDYKKCCTLTV